MTRGDDWDDLYDKWADPNIDDKVDDMWLEMKAEKKDMIYKIRTFFDRDVDTIGKDLTQLEVLNIFKIIKKFYED